MTENEFECQNMWDLLLSCFHASKSHSSTKLLLNSYFCILILRENYKMLSPPYKLRTACKDGLNVVMFDSLLSAQINDNLNNLDSALYQVQIFSKYYSDGQ